MKRREGIPPTDEEILAYDNVPSDVAARYVGMSAPTIYAGLKQERVPFGFAVQNEETETWTYNISPGGLVKYKHEGKPIIQLGDLRELMADSAKEVLDAKMQSLDRVMRAVLDA